MRTRAMAVVVLGVGAAAWPLGCSNLSGDCKELQTCCPDGTQSCIVGSSSSSSGGGTPPGCVPSESDKPVADTCGIFVSSSLGKDLQEGTKSAPVASLQHALEVANGRPVYACAEAFPGSVTIANGSAIYGGLDCANEWTYVGAATKSTLTGEADRIAVTFGIFATGAEVVDFTIQAPNATAPGGSSIAMLVGGTPDVKLTRTTLEAADGKEGVAGEAAASAAQAGVKGRDGGTACSASIVVGADVVTSMCGDSESTSGAGGNGLATGGGAGTPGTPDGAANGGFGESSSGCTPGTVGISGTPGTPGAGATALGQIDRDGYLGAVGIAGTRGGPGQGGGGGGGAKGGTGAGKCGSTSGGASGGSGGSGGCGGAGGKGGGAGGVSIALISVKATNLTLTEVTLRTGNGGKGGDGGTGQDGGSGGQVGKGGIVGTATALKPGCDGGPGGQGGKGGRGGGGRGGHAIGLAATGGSVPPMDGVTIEQKGMAGSGGKGADMAHEGAVGLQMPVQEFP